MFPLATNRPLTPEDFALRPAGYVHLAATLHQAHHAIAEVATRWRPSHMIHGDFKVDNLLVRMDPRFTEQPPAVIVDWEMAPVA